MAKRVWVLAAMMALASQLAAGVVAAAPPLSLGSLALGGRTDRNGAYVARGGGEWDYRLDVVQAGGRLRVAIDTSTRGDCFALDVVDPGGHLASGLVDGRVCQPDTPQAYDREVIVPRAATGSWSVRVVAIDVVDWAFRIRAMLGPRSSQRQDGGAGLPDLLPWVPSEFGFAAPGGGRPGLVADRDQVPGSPGTSCEGALEPGARHCLRFSAGAYDAGAGPLVVVVRHGVAYQRLAGPGGGRDRRIGPAPFDETHGHRHIADFAAYELFAVTDVSAGGAEATHLRPVGESVKRGFCTMSQQVADWSSDAQEPWWASIPQGRYCLDDMSLARGWGDLYRYQRPGQYLPYDAVAATDGSMIPGRYVVRVTVDPSDRIVESDENDNVGYSSIEVAPASASGDQGITVCEQGLGTSPWDPARRTIPDRLEWAMVLKDPGYEPAACTGEAASPSVSPSSGPDRTGSSPPTAAPATPPSPEPTTAGPSPAPSPEVRQGAPVRRTDGGHLPSWARATLERDPTGLTVTIETPVRGRLSTLEGDRLPAAWHVGDAVTMWWFVFDHPERCVGSCGLDDVLRYISTGDDSTGLGEHYATGHVTSSGTWQATARLAVGDASGMVMGEALSSPLTASVIVEVRSHGAARQLTSRQLRAAVTRVDGACKVHVCGTAQVARFGPP